MALLYNMDSTIDKFFFSFVAVTTVYGPFNAYFNGDSHPSLCEVATIVEIVGFDS